METRNFKRAYVWELPVRIFHWTNALCVLVLIVTGFLIANPPALISSAEASNRYWFGTVRLIHFISAYIFVFSIVLRTYWAFAGNRYARWNAFIPVRRASWRNIGHVLKVDVFLMKSRYPSLKDIPIGHNALAALSYIMLFLLSLTMIFTGFGLYAPMSDWWLPNLFNWVVPLLGGDSAARLIHHTSMWLIIFFVMVHVYLVLFHDWVEGRGSILSMLSGYKYVRVERVKEDVEEEEPEESPVEA